LKQWRIKKEEYNEISVKTRLSIFFNGEGEKVAIPRYNTTAGGKIPLHLSNVVALEDDEYTLQKQWNGEDAIYPDVDSKFCCQDLFSFNR
jgi:hypothetical protein